MIQKILLFILIIVLGFTIGSLLFVVCHKGIRQMKSKIKSNGWSCIFLLLSLFYLLIFIQNDYTTETILYCLFTTALLLLSIIDLITYEIPIQINLFIGALGIIRILTDPAHITSYLIGFFSVSTFLLIIYILTKGKCIGGGDIKLMAVSGLIVGFPNIIVAFLIGCILGSIIHTIRCKVSNANHMLAFGPYLSVGLFLSMLYGEQILSWYLNLF